MVVFIIIMVEIYPIRLELNLKMLSLSIIQLQKEGIYCVDDANDIFYGVSIINNLVTDQNGGGGINSILEFTRNDCQLNYYRTETIISERMYQISYSEW